MAFLSTFVGVGKHSDPNIRDLIDSTKELRVSAPDEDFADAMGNFLAGVPKVNAVQPLSQTNQLTELGVMRKPEL